MLEAVVRVDLDPRDDLPADQLAAGLDRLRAQGLVLRGRAGGHDVDLMLGGADEAEVREGARAACLAVLEGTEPEIVTVTFVSRGRDDDALGIVRAFGTTAILERFDEGGEEVAQFALPASDRSRIPESRLHTALEAALNGEVRIVFG